MSQFMKQAFYKQRADFQKDLPARDKKYTLCSGVTELKDIPYAEDGLPAHRLDLYQPENAADQKLPVILNVHGGGLLLGCKEFNHYFCAKLKSEFINASHSYRRCDLSLHDYILVV